MKLIDDCFEEGKYDMQGMKLIVHCDMKQPEQNKLILLNSWGGLVCIKLITFRWTMVRSLCPGQLMS